MNTNRERALIEKKNYLLKKKNNLMMVQEIITEV